MCKAVGQALGLAPKIPAMPAPAAPPPAPAAPPPTPDKVLSEDGSTTAKSAAEEAARQQAQRQRGRGTTILTGPQGLMGAAPVARASATRVLLGG